MDIERKTIFLVDDDATNLTIGKIALAERYKVLTLDSGVRLLKILEKSIPDLILLDVEMPVMSGYETLKILKSQNETKHIPVIFLTAKIGNEHRTEGLSCGAVDYITKPFSSQHLLQQIEVHLGGG